MAWKPSYKEPQSKIGTREYRYYDKVWLRVCVICGLEFKVRWLMHKSGILPKKCYECKNILTPHEKKMKRRLKAKYKRWYKTNYKGYRDKVIARRKKQAIKKHRHNWFNHKTAPVEPGPFPCDHCGKEYTQKKALISHQSWLTRKVWKY